MGLARCCEVVRRLQQLSPESILAAVAGGKPCLINSFNSASQQLSASTGTPLNPRSCLMHSIPIPQWEPAHPSQREVQSYTWL